MVFAFTLLSLPSLPFVRTFSATFVHASHFIKRLSFVCVEGERKKTSRCVKVVQQTFLQFDGKVRLLKPFSYEQYFVNSVI